jgi:Ca2+-binding EF-hand superfamily protein/serine/threonine protein kinase
MITLNMSRFQAGLDFFKKVTEELKDIDEDIPEEISTPSPRSPEAKTSLPASIQQIKEQAKLNSERQFEEENKGSNTAVSNFKKFLNKDKREKLISMCEAQDLDQQGYVSFMAINRVLSRMGFRLKFDDLKLLFQILNIYDENHDKIYYRKLLSAVFRKLYSFRVPSPRAKMTQNAAVLAIQTIWRNIKRKRQEKIQAQKAKGKPGLIDPKLIIEGITQKVRNSYKSLLQSFQEIDRDQSGFIEKRELNQLLYSYLVNLKPEELDSAFKLIDKENKGKISYKDLASAIDVYQTSEQKDLLRSVSISESQRDTKVNELMSLIQDFINSSGLNINAIFQKFDSSKKGFSEFDEFYKALQEIDSKISEFDARLLFTLLDVGKRERVTLEEFSKRFLFKEEKREVVKKEDPKPIEQPLTPKPEPKPEETLLTQVIKTNEDVKKPETAEILKEISEAEKKSRAERNFVEEIAKEREKVLREEERKSGYVDRKRDRENEDVKKSIPQLSFDPFKDITKSDKLINIKTESKEEVAFPEPIKKPDSTVPELNKKPEISTPAPVKKFEPKFQEPPKKPELHIPEPQKKLEAKIAESSKKLPSISESLLEEAVIPKQPSLKQEIESKLRFKQEEDRKNYLLKTADEMLSISDLKCKQELMSSLQKLEEESKQLSDVKKKREDENRKKFDELSKTKQDRSKIQTSPRALSVSGKDRRHSTPMNISKLSGTPASSNQTSSRRPPNLKRFVKPKPTLAEKANKILNTPQQSEAIKKMMNKETEEMIRNEFLIPLVEAAVEYGESLNIARGIQSNFEKRPVFKYLYIQKTIWEQSVNAPVCRSLWGIGDLGRVGILDTRGSLSQFDLAEGHTLQTLFLGTRPPFKQVPILATAFDSALSRFYVLDKQWVLEIWELHQNKSVPIDRIRVLNKLIGQDYIEKFYVSRLRGLTPAILSLTSDKNILINATSVDGFIYILDPVSFTTLHKIQFLLNELATPEHIEKGMNQLSLLLTQCIKLGISQDRVFQLLDMNADGLLNFDEFKKGIQDLKLPLTREQIAGMFKEMDINGQGYVSLAEFTDSMQLKKQVESARVVNTEEEFNLPPWASSVFDNEKARDAMLKLYTALERKGYTMPQICSVFDASNSGCISAADFSRTVQHLLGSVISGQEVELLIKVADPSGRGVINYVEFMQLLDKRNLITLKQASILNSGALPRDSILYVIHKCLELNIDLYKLFQQLDRSISGSLPRHIFLHKLLTLPLGLSIDHLTSILDKDVQYSSNGDIDYTSLFQNKDYLALLTNSKKPPSEFIYPSLPEQACIIEDIVYIEELDAVIYTTISPMTSTIFIKRFNGPLLAKLMGHKGDYPPALLYVSCSNCLISGERRLIKQRLGKSDKENYAECEILVWNLQRDLVDKYSVKPPWTIRPYRKVKAHEGSVLDLCYLPVTQLVVSCGLDSCIKVWNPTGVPYNLKEVHSLPVAPRKPGFYKEVPNQYTQTNQMFSMVICIKLEEGVCYKLEPCVHSNVEWLLALQLGSGKSRANSGNIVARCFGRYKLEVPAYKLDVDLPESVAKRCIEMFNNSSNKRILAYRARLPIIISGLMTHVSVDANLQSEIYDLLRNSVLYEKPYPEILDKISLLPMRKRVHKGPVSLPELYRLLITHNVLKNVSLETFTRCIKDLDNRHKQKAISYKEIEEMDQTIKSETNLAQTRKFFVAKKVSSDFTQKIVKNRFMTHTAKLKDCLANYANEQGILSTSDFKRLLEKEYDIPSSSAIADLLLKDLCNNGPLHHTQIFINIRNFNDVYAYYAGESKGKLFRKILERIQEDEGDSLSETAKRLLDKWKEQKHLESDTINIHDFINSIRTVTRKVKEEFLAEFLGESDRINYILFANEAFIGIPGVLTQNLQRKAEEELRIATEEALKVIHSTLKISGASLERGLILFDDDSDGKIIRSEFEAAMVLLDVKLNREDINSIFKSFDSEAAGKISIKEIVKEVENVFERVPMGKLMIWINLVNKLPVEIVMKVADTAIGFKKRIENLVKGGMMVGVSLFTQELKNINKIEEEEVEILTSFAVEATKREGDIDKEKNIKIATQSEPLVNFFAFVEAMKSVADQQMKLSEPLKSNRRQESTSRLNSDRKTLEVQSKESKDKKLETSIFTFVASTLNSKKITAQKLFIEVDMDNDGVISIQEFRDFLIKLGYRFTSDQLSSFEKSIVANSDGCITFKEFRTKLIGHGYIETAETELYTHNWTDKSVQIFLSCFKQQREFKDFQSLFSYFDYNKDGTLTVEEFYKALSAISGESAERVMNIVITKTHRALDIDKLAGTLYRMAEEIMPPNIETISNEAKLAVFQSLNPISQLKTVINELSELCLSINRKQKLGKVRRGIDLYAVQFSTSEILVIISILRTKMTETIDSILSVGLSKILSKAYLSLIDSSYDTQLSIPSHIDMPIIPTFDLDQFKVDWDSVENINLAIKEYKGIILSNMNSVKIVLYSPEGIRYISSDGVTLEKHLDFELKFHLLVQDLAKNVIKCTGKYEKKVGVEANDKEMYIFYEEISGNSIRNLVLNNGGLFNIPILYNSRTSIYIARFWARQLLQLIHGIHSYGGVLRLLSSERVLVSEDGLEIKLNSLRGLGEMDSNGKIISAPDLKMCIRADESYHTNPYIAPEFLIDNKQSSAVDIWSIGVLLYEMIFGVPPPSVLEAYKVWWSEKGLSFEGFEGDSVPNLSPSFCYYIYEGKTVENGKSCEDLQNNLNLIRSIRKASFSGIVRDSMNAEVQEVYQEIMTREVKQATTDTEIGEFLDIIGLCLQINPKKRPTISGLLNSKVFNLDNYETLQAKRIAPRLLFYKSPELKITQEVTLPLRELCKRASEGILMEESVLRLIQKVELLLSEQIESKIMNAEVSTLLTQTQDKSSFTIKEKQLMMNEALKSPVAPLAKQVSEDGVLDLLVFLALRYLKYGNRSITQRLTEVLSGMIFEMYTYTSPLAPFIPHIFESLLKLFIGEEIQLLSSHFKAVLPQPLGAFVLRESSWEPDLYMIVGPLYKDIIDEEGRGQNYYPVIRDYLSTNRSPDYYSVLVSIADNIMLLKRPDSTKTARRLALRHIRAIFQLSNEHKLKAMLDFRLPQHIVHCIQYDDAEVRLETILIFFEISKGCLPNNIPIQPANTQNEKIERDKMVNCLMSSIKMILFKHETEIRNIAESGQTGPSLSVRELARCFEAQMFTVLLVRGLKLKSEPYDNREGIIRCLINILQGSDTVVKAACSPATDTIATISKSLVISSRNVDTRSSKVISQVLKDNLSLVLERAGPELLRRFELTHGAKACLKEQGLIIPKPITLSKLLDRLPDHPTIDLDIPLIILEAQNWLKYTYRSGIIPHATAHSAIHRILNLFRDTVDLLWPIAAKLTSDLYSPELRLRARSSISKVFEMLEWLINEKLDYLWLRSFENIYWIAYKYREVLLGLEDDKDVYPMVFQGVQLLKILTKCMCSAKLKEILSSLDMKELLLDLLPDDEDILQLKYKTFI